MSLKKTALAKVTILIVSIAAYAQIFSLQTSDSTKQFAIVAVIPIITAGLLYGFRGGFIAGILAFPLNIIMYALLLHESMATVLSVYSTGRILGQIGLILIGCVVGRMQDLSKTADQAVRKHREAEIKLKEINANQENIIKARTEELLESIEMLKARDQELRAINEQLEASFQQLKASEHDIRESRERLALHLHQTLVGVIEWNNSFEVTEWNPAAERIFEYTRSEALGRHGRDLIIAPEAREQLDKIWDSILGQKGGTFSINKNITKTGRIIECEWHNTPLIDRNGAVIGVASLCQDITARRQAEAERAMLISAINQADEAIFIISIDGKVQYLNPAGESMFGYSKETAVGRNPFFFSELDSEQLLQYTRAWDTITAGWGWRGRVHHKMPNGLTNELEMVISPIRNRTGEATNFVGVCRDITNELNLQKQLRQSQKMEAIGTLAGGIAHDFNNILTAIIGFTELANMNAPAGTDLHRYLNQVLHAGERARNLVRQILTFSRQTEQELKPVHIKPVMTETINFLRASLPSTILIQQCITTDNDLVLADPGQLQQVLMNLCTNAKDAMMDTGGILELGLRAVAFQSDTATGQPEILAGDYLLLSVRDTGHGMQESMLEKIFDPFFTTKQPGKGTGLGLSVVHGIIKSCKGDIKVYSEPGKGTEFRIWLPMVKDEGTERHETEQDEYKGGSEHILVVDDEAANVELLEKQLELLGYTVTSRTSSLEALELFRTQPERFDLVITDQTMPNLTGMQLVQEIMKIRSTIPVILCTGFSETVTPERSQALGLSAFLMKPVTRKELAATIRKVLDRTSM